MRTGEDPGGCSGEVILPFHCHYCFQLSLEPTQPLPAAGAPGSTENTRELGKEQAKAEDPPPPTTVQY